MNEQQKSFLEGVFGQGGILENFGFTRRTSQIKMVSAVADAIDKRDTLICEASTGTGKSIAYLVDSIRESIAHNQPVIVATSNKSLQSQIVNKDLPMLRQILPFDFSYMLVKGRNNYLCRYMFKSFCEEGENLFENMMPDKKVSDARQKLIEWGQSTETGDNEELDFDPKFLWSKISVSGKECLKKKCPFFETCYANQAKRGMFSKNIIVVNYHMLMTSFEIERGEILPPSCALICDEAHNIADIARSYRSVEFGEGSMHWFTSRAKKHADEKLIKKFMSACQDMFIQATNIVKQSAPKKFRGGKEQAQTRIKYGALTIQTEYAQKSLSRVISDLSTAAKSDTIAEDESAKITILVTHGNELLKTLQKLQDGTTDETVCWIDTNNDKVTLNASPIEVSDFLSVNLFKPDRATILTSATLTTGGTFGFVASEIGLPETATKIRLKSPFDIPNQGMLFVPARKDRTNDFDDSETIQLMYRAINSTRGGVLCLFTSVRTMNRAHAFLRDKLVNRALLIQGQTSRSLLLEEFKRDTSSVLLATKSFFEGIDVPGEALQLVVIDRLPFPVPDDPMVMAIQEKMDRKGLNGWFSHSLPVASLTMAQAAGRLIRSTADKGAVVVLDNRLVDKPYGASVVKSLPPFKPARDWNEFETFMKKI